MELAPGERRARARELEAHHVPLVGELAREEGVLGEAALRRDVVIEHDELSDLAGEAAVGAGRRRDVREEHVVPRVLVRPERVLVPPRHVDAALAPGEPGGPGGAEAIRAASVVDADAAHGAKGTRVAPR